MKTSFAISLFFVLLCGECVASDLFVYITRDSAHTNLIQTICGRPLSLGEFTNTLAKVGENARKHGFSLPVQITENITIADLLSTLDTLQNAGITNYYIQVRSVAGPTKMTDKNDIVLRIEDYSKEPVDELMKNILRSMRKADQGVKININDGAIYKDDIPVDTNGL